MATPSKRKLSKLELLPNEILYAIIDHLFPKHAVSAVTRIQNEQDVFDDLDQVHEAIIVAVQSVANLVKAAPFAQPVALQCLKRRLHDMRQQVTELKLDIIPLLVSNICKIRDSIKQSVEAQAYEQSRRLRTELWRSYLQLLYMLGCVETSFWDAYNVNVALEMLECGQRQTGACLYRVPDRAVKDFLDANLVFTITRCGLCGLFRSGWKCCANGQPIVKLDHCKTVFDPNLPYTQQTTLRQDHHGSHDLDYEFRTLPSRLFRLIRSSDMWTADGVHIFGPRSQCIPASELRSRESRSSIEMQAP